MHLPGNGVSQLFCSIHLHVLGQTLEASTLRLSSQLSQKLLCMSIGMLTVAADVLHHSNTCCGVMAVTNIIITIDD